MRFNVAALLKETVGATRKFELSDDINGIDQEIKAVSPLRGSVKLTRTNDSILAEARLRVTIQATCGRCLAEFTMPLDLRFAEQFQPVVDIATGLPLPGPEDRSVFTIDESHVLDLSEAVRQYILVSLPIAPLCKSDCAGLCPQCGHDLNQGPCECPRQVGDPRLAILADLFNDNLAGQKAPPGKNKKRK